MFSFCCVFVVEKGGNNPAFSVEVFESDDPGTNDRYFTTRENRKGIARMISGNIAQK